MSISVVDRKRLWGRAGNRCAMTECRRELVEPQGQPGADVVTGEEAHIIAREADGPRGDSPLTAAERDIYDNLILLCSRHHTIIDRDPDSFSVQFLHELKEQHEGWVRRSLDTSKQGILEWYAARADELEDRLLLNRWNDIFGSLTGATPFMPYWAHFPLEEASVWLESIVWPGQIPQLESAFMNFQQVLNDLLTCFDQGNPDASANDGKLKLTRPNRWHSSDEKVEEFDTLVILVTNLTIELTRAGNHLCNAVRKHLSQSYRLDAGALMIELQGTRIVRPEYRSSDGDRPYPGLSDFPNVGPSRDCFLRKK